MSIGRFLICRGQWRNLVITIYNYRLYINPNLVSWILNTLMFKQLVVIFSLLSAAAFAANFSSSHRLVFSPNTSKTFLLFNSHSSSTYEAARAICASYPNGKLAELAAGTGDVDFLGRYVESLEEPYWIGGLVDSATSVPCAAIYSGGAVAIPKPSKRNESPCAQKLNVLCEIE